MRHSFGGKINAGTKPGKIVICYYNRISHKSWWKNNKMGLLIIRSFKCSKKR